MDIYRICRSFEWDGSRCCTCIQLCPQYNQINSLWPYRLFNFGIAYTYYTSKFSNSNSKFDFQCLNYPHLQGVLNDDYCDCPDGSDEPLTSACSHLLVGQKLFSCTAASNGEAIKLFPSRIRDGVIDCQDGADEK